MLCSKWLVKLLFSCTAVIPGPTLYPAAQMRNMANTANERIIVIMGATGSGKSALIRLVTGNEKIRVGNGLISGTYDSSL